MRSSELIDLTRPAAATELLKEARCHACQGQDRRCLVEQDHGHCVSCSSSRDCIFERSVKLLGSASKFTWEQLTGQAAPPNRAHLEHGPRVQRAPSAVARPAISASTLGAWEPSSSQIVGQNSSHSWQLAGLGSGTSSVPQKRKHAEHAKYVNVATHVAVTDCVRALYLG